MTFPALEESTHTYTVDGAETPGVSEILGSVGTKRTGKLGTEYWRSIGGGEFYRDETARDFGTHFHGYPALRLGKGSVAPLQRSDIDYSPKMAPWIDQWECWWAANRGEIVTIGGMRAVELSLYSRVLGYCGTPDVAMIHDGKTPVVVDWKTGPLTDIYRVKMAAYIHLLEINTSIRGWHSWIVSITGESAEPAVDKLTPRHMERHLNDWRSIVNVYRAGR